MINQNTNLNFVDFHFDSNMNYLKFIKLRKMILKIMLWEIKISEIDLTYY